MESLVTQLALDTTRVQLRISDQPLLVTTECQMTFKKPQPAEVVETVVAT